MSEITIYHNPRCSKSRQTLALLTNRGLFPRIVHYLDAPPPAATLKRLLKMLAMHPRQLMRTHEAVYTELGLDDPKLTDDELIVDEQHDRGVGGLIHADSWRDAPGGNDSGAVRSP